MKTAFLCFFPVIPTNMGSAEVIRSLFLCWPGRKKIFQISHLKNKKNNNLETIKIIKEKPMFKLLSLPFIIFKILKFFRKSKNNIIIIEGPSWIGYSFISMIIIKLFSPSTKIIYHSHSIEYEVRKMMSSYIIAIISKKLENLVFKFSDLATSVSKVEINKIKKLYNVKCVNLKNGISKKILKFKKKKIYNFEYLIYTGSYKYLPNKLAINFIVKNLMPKINEKHPNIKLILTGGGYDKKEKFLINVGIVPKAKLLNLIYNSKLMIVPLDKGTGTRIKIIEAMAIGTNVLSTPIGAEGIINTKQKDMNPIIAKKKDFFQIINKVLNQNYKIHKNIQLENEYLMENITYKFFKERNVKNIIKKN